MIYATRSSEIHKYTINELKELQAEAHPHDASVVRFKSSPAIDFLGTGLRVDVQGNDYDLAWFPRYFVAGFRITDEMEALSSHAYNNLTMRMAKQGVSKCCRKITENRAHEDEILHAYVTGW